MSPLRILSIGAVAVPACFLVTDFDVEDVASAASTAASGGSAVAPAQGGASCEGLDLSSDEANCGSCGFVCGSAECVNGTCAESIDLAAHGGDIRSVLVDGDTVYFVQHDPRGAGGAGGADPNMGTLWTLPVDFTASSTPALAHPVDNVVGQLVSGSLGSHHVYFAGQISKTIYACQPTECVEVFLGAAIQTQVNGMTAVDDVLYLIAAAGDNRLLSLPLDATTGIPAVRPTYLVTSYAPAIANAGVLELYHLRSPTRLYWSSYDNDGSNDGCIYRIETANVPSSALPCWSPSFVAQGFVVAGDGTVYGQNGAITIFKISGEPPVAEPFATNAAYPRAIDARYLYVTNAASFTIRSLPLDGGAEAPETAVPPAALTALSAKHDVYLYYAAGSTLLRWPKPN